MPAAGRHREHHPRLNTASRERNIPRSVVTRKWVTVVFFRPMSDAPSNVADAQLRTRSGKRPSASSLKRQREFVEWLTAPGRAAIRDDDRNELWKAFMADRERKRLQQVAERRRDERRSEGRQPRLSKAELVTSERDILQFGDKAQNANGTRLATTLLTNRASVMRCRRELKRPVIEGPRRKPGPPKLPDAVKAQRRDEQNQRRQEEANQRLVESFQQRETERRAWGAGRSRRDLAWSQGSLQNLLQQYEGHPAHERAEVEVRHWRKMASTFLWAMHHDQRMWLAKRAKAYAAKADAAAAAAAAQHTEEPALLKAQAMAERAEQVYIAAGAVAELVRAERVRTRWSSSRRGQRCVSRRGCLIVHHNFWQLLDSELEAAGVPYRHEDDSDYDACDYGVARKRDAMKEAWVLSRRFSGQARTEWSTEGQCEGTTRLGERCKVHKSSDFAVAAPLRRGERFCAHHHPDKYTGVRCAGIKKHGKSQCCVWSGSLYGDAAPLRRGSPFCHHHRVRCAGTTQAGVRCTVTSSSEHTHAEPLRRGELYCAHHRQQASPAEHAAAASTSIGASARDVQSADHRQQASPAEHAAAASTSAGASARDVQSADDSSVLAEEDLPDSDGEFPPRRCRCGELRRFCGLEGDGHQTESDASDSGSEDSEDECRAPPCDPDLCTGCDRCDGVF